jgi:hypothetical protein
VHGVEQLRAVLLERRRHFVYCLRSITRSCRAM